jgi:hypothetical protein
MQIDAGRHDYSLPDRSSASSLLARYFPGEYERICVITRVQIFPVNSLFAMHLPRAHLGWCPRRRGDSGALETVRVRRQDCTGCLANSRTNLPFGLPVSGTAEGRFFIH